MALLWIFCTAQSKAPIRFRPSFTFLTACVSRRFFPPRLRKELIGYKMVAMRFQVMTAMADVRVDISSIR